MTISTYTTFKTRVETSQLRLGFSKVAVNTNASFRMCSSWLFTPFAGTAPSTAVAPTDATTGAINNQWSTLGSFTNTLYLAEVENQSTALLNTVGFTLVDRLSHQGGLDGTNTGAQTTNLPTAALTRYTSGLGVMAALEIYTDIGTTARTATVSYTNESGTAGRTSKTITIGGGVSNAASSGVVLPILPQDGDMGFRSVESVTLSGSTGTVGNFGVTLFKPLHVSNSFYSMPQDRVPYRDGLICGPGDIVPVSPNSCLALMVSCGTTGTGCSIIGQMIFIEG